MAQHNQPDYSSRREFVGLGLGGFSVLSLPQLIQNRCDAAKPAHETKNTTVILVWLPGGHSHLETDAPQGAGFQ